MAAGGGPLETYDAPVSARLDDFRTDFASSLTFPTAGSLAAPSFDILSDESFYDANFADTAVTGYVNGLEVASDIFDMFAVNGTPSFRGAFLDIDRLVVGFAELPSGLVCDDASCAHQSIHGVTLAPVPLPASGALLAFAVPRLTAAQRRKR